MADDTVVIKLTLDKKDAEKFLKALPDKFGKAGDEAGEEFTDGFGKNLKGVNAAVAGVGRSIARLGTTIAAGFIAKFSFDKVITSTREFSRSIAEVNSILGTNSKITKETTDTFREFSKSFGTAASTQAQAFYNIVSAGVRGTAKQLKVLATANKAAIAGLVDIDTAAKVLVSSVNSYSKSGLTAAQASDALFVAVREGQTTFGELSANLGNVAPLAAAAGLKFSELSGALAFVTKSGVGTAEATTGIRALLVSLIKPSEGAQQAAKELGIQFDTAALRADGFAGFIQKVITATGGNEKALARLFPNVRALGSVINIARGDFEDFERILGETEKSANATARAAKELEKSFDFQLNQLESELNDIALTVGEVLVPALLKGVKGFKLIGGLARTAFGFGDTKDKINEVTTEIGALGKQIELVKEGGAGFGVTGFIDDLVGTNINEETLARLEEQMRVLFARRDELVTQLGEESRAAMEADGTGIAPKISDQDAEAVKNKTVEVGGFFKSMYAGISSDSEEFSKKAKNNFKGLSGAAAVFGQSLKKGIGQGLGSGFAAFGAALQKGESAFDAFAAAFLSTLGQMMIQQGAAFILQGLGFAVIPGIGTAVSGPLIAAGAGLAALGGALTAVGGGSAGAAGASASGVGGGAIGADSTIATEVDRDELEEGLAEPTTNISLRIDGDVIGDDGPDKIMALLNESIESSGTVITNKVRFA